MTCLTYLHGVVSYLPTQCRVVSNLPTQCRVVSNLPTVSSLTYLHSAVSNLPTYIVPCLTYQPT